MLDNFLISFLICAVDPVKMPHELDLPVWSGDRLWIFHRWGGWTRPSTCSPPVLGSLLSGTSRPLLSAWPTSWLTQPRVLPTGMRTWYPLLFKNVVLSWSIFRLSVFFRFRLTHSVLCLGFSTATLSRRRTRSSVWPRPIVKLDTRCFLYSEALFKEVQKSKEVYASCGVRNMHVFLLLVHPF